MSNIWITLLICFCWHISFSILNMNQIWILFLLNTVQTCCVSNLLGTFTIFIDYVQISFTVLIVIIWLTQLLFRLVLHLCLSLFFFFLYFFCDNLHIFLYQLFWFQGLKFVFLIFFQLSFYFMEEISFLVEMENNWFLGVLYYFLWHRKILV